MTWLAAGCVSSLVFIVVAAGTFVPFQNPDGVEYFFAAPTPIAVLTSWLLCIGGLSAAYFAVRTWAARSDDRDLVAQAQSGRWLAPLAALGIVVLGILPAIPGVGERGAIVGFAFYDLRWWWAAALTGLAIARADRVTGAPLARALRDFAAWSPAVRLLVLDVLMFTGVIAWALATTSNPYDNGLGGDEPKYVRYCEVWYQGLGLDISRLALVSDEPLDARPPLLHNASLLVAAVPEGIGAAVHDLREFIHDPTHFRWNRAEASNGFVTGIHGGLYQQYSPGMSIVLFPGYFVDRYLLNVNASEDGKWPADLTMTKTMMLLMYAFCGVMLFRLFRHALDSELLAWLWSALAMLTLPTTAFAFQMYPELPALFVILAVSNEVLFGSRSWVASAALAGAATGLLGWIHVRFLLIAVCLAALAFVMKKDRARWAFQATFACFVFSLMMFNYRVTGSWWPTALWDANGMGVSFGADFVRNVVGYAFDRRWGLLPHTLLLVGAIPGLVLLARQSRLHAAFVAVVVAGLVAASAGHTLIGAATTPDRLILAVTPLLFWPVAVLVRHFWFRPVFRVVTVSFAIVSLDAGRAYNWVDAKGYGILRDASLSGWKPNLGFPDIRGESWDLSNLNLEFLIGMAAIVAVLTVLAFTATRPEAISRSNRTAAGGRHPWMVSAATILALLLVFAATTSVNDDWASGLYLMQDFTARATAARVVVSRDRCLCFTSARGHVDWSNLGPNSARSALIDMFPEGLRMTVLLLVQGDGNWPAFGRMRVEFGDGEQTPWTGVLAEKRVPHVYRQPGTYEVRVWFQLPTRVAPQVHSKLVEVREGL